METNSSPTTEVSVKDLFNLLVVDLTLHRRVPDTLHTSLSLLASMYSLTSTVCPLLMSILPASPMIKSPAFALTL